MPSRSRLRPPSRVTADPVARNAPPPGVAPPRAEDLARIAPDPWAWLIPHLRSALRAVDEEQLPAAERLRATPAVRLAGGRVRAEVEELLSRGGPLWAELHRRLAAVEDAPDELAWLLEGRAPGPVEQVVVAEPDARDREREERLRGRAQRLKQERDDARRQLDGADARARQAAEERDELQRELERLTRQVDELGERLEAADAEREQAVERERRRGAAELEQLRGELADLRRAEQERQAAERRRAATSTERGAGGAVGAPAGSQPTSRPRGGAAGRTRPGRPTELPAGVRPDTREAVEALLAEGRRVLVDGYNLTLTQRPDLPLDQQRAWLVQALATQVARRGIRPTVVFDSDVAGPGGRSEKGRGVIVRYTAEGTTADDELVFAVAALEEHEPVLVVTDDRELRDRLRPYGVDVVSTASFSWVLR